MGHLYTTLLAPGSVATGTGFCELISVLCSGSKVSAPFQGVASIKIKDLQVILGMTETLIHTVQEKVPSPSGLSIPSDIFYGSVTAIW